MPEESYRVCSQTRLHAKRANLCFLPLPIFLLSACALDDLLDRT
jgi:hypothetical protein